MIQIGLTDHLEGPRDRSSALVFDEVSELVRQADRLGVHYAWFTEHHAHIHHGHLPAPLLFALHLMGQTRRIRLGTAVICLNLHHPLDVAEQTAVADVLAGGRLAPGFGSGSTPGEFCLFDVPETEEHERHARFQEALGVIREIWSGSIAEHANGYFRLPEHRPLPVPAADLWSRTWIAVNSAGSARIAGALGLNMLFSHLRTPAQYREYTHIYHQAGGQGLIAANRPVFVAATDAEAWSLAEPALRILWRRFQAEGKIPAERVEPESPTGLIHHPINFIVGGPDSVARQLLDLHAQVPFDVANVELRWAGLDHHTVLESLRRLMEDVMPQLANHKSPTTATRS